MAQNVWSVRNINNEMKDVDGHNARILTMRMFFVKCGGIVMEIFGRYIKKVYLSTHILETYKKGE